MNLIEMEPRGDLSSTGYVLANPGKEYLILQPGEKAGTFTVSLDTGTYQAEWFSVNSRETVGADQVRVKSATPISLSAPFEAAGPAVLYLKRVSA
jgi:hypothetical protein